MAMIGCPECTTEISDSAMNCPSCGVQLRKPRRGFFGVIIKWSFILFNIFMIFALFSGLSSTGDTMETMTSDAEKAGAAIGTGIGVVMIMGFWVLGDIILGLLVLFTRPKS